jgi:hypothetical protein
MTRRKLAMIIVLVVFGAIISLVAHSRMVSDESLRVAVFSAENFRGVSKWWLFGAPFYLFLIFAPDKYFLDEDDEDTGS